MKNTKRQFILTGLTAVSLSLLLLHVTAQTSPAQSNDAALVAKAKLIHSHVLKLDTHNDIEPANFTPECNYLKRLTTQAAVSPFAHGHFGCQRNPP